MIPGKIGSDVRERGKIDGLVSGVREAGKGLAYGWWDGITGLATEPIKGGQKEGALGVLKGMGRSCEPYIPCLLALLMLDINVWARPAAGELQPEPEQCSRGTAHTRHNGRLRPPPPGSIPLHAPESIRYPLAPHPRTAYRPFAPRGCVDVTRGEERDRQAVRAGR